MTQTRARPGGVQADSAGACFCVGVGDLATGAGGGGGLICEPGRDQYVLGPERPQWRGHVTITDDPTTDACPTSPTTTTNPAAAAVAVTVTPRCPG